MLLRRGGILNIPPATQASGGCVAIMNNKALWQVEIPQQFTQPSLIGVQLGRQAQLYCPGNMSVHNKVLCTLATTTITLFLVLSAVGVDHAHHALAVPMLSTPDGRVAAASELAASKWRRQRALPCLKQSVTCAIPAEKFTKEV